MKRTIIILLLSIVSFKLILTATDCDEGINDNENTTTPERDEMLFNKSIECIWNLSNTTTFMILDPQGDRVSYKIQEPFRDDLIELTRNLTKPDFDVYQASKMRMSTYYITKTYLSDIELVNSSLLNFKEQLDLLKMHVYKFNSDAIQKIHSLLNTLPLSNLPVYIQYKYKIPSPVFIPAQYANKVSY